MKPVNEKRNDTGIAMVTTLLLTLLLSVLVAAMLFSSTADTLIGGNDVRTNEAFYIAEAGINRSAGWFSSKFGTDPNSGLFILPQQTASNSSGTADKFSYTDPPYYQKGASITAPEQATPSSVKILAGGNLQNVVLAGDSSNTYPTSYRVGANDSSGAHTVFNYDNVVTDFTNNLVNQTAGEGQFTVKATLISIILPNGVVQGTATWLLQSTAKIKRGSRDIASATMYGYLSAHLTPVEDTVTLPNGVTRVAATPGVIGRKMVKWRSNSATVDSYRSSKGTYNAALAANSFQGQIGTHNRGKRGDIRTNNEPLADGTHGFIQVQNGTITGSAFATDPAPAPSATYNPIDILLGHVSNGYGGDFTASSEFYGADPLYFAPITAIPTPTGTTNYEWNSKNNGTLPAGNYRNVTVTKGQLTVPPGTYKDINVATQGTLVLGVAGQQSVYNFQSFSSNAQATIVYRGPVTINVQSGLDAGAGSDVNSVVPPSAIRWNFVGGAGQLVYIGGHGAVVGVFYAPNNDLEIRGGGDFYGTVAALSVDVNGNMGIHVDEDAISGVQRNVAMNITTTSTVGYTATNYSLWRITQAIN
jgi:hypothetical protein